MSVLSGFLRILVVMLMVFLSHALFGQDENRFRNFHGIWDHQNNIEFFEAEGYDIFIQLVNNGLDEKGISKIRKKYSARDSQLVIDSLTNLKVLTKTEQTSGVTAYFSYYLIPETSKSSRVIGFARPKSRDLVLEHYLVKSYLSKTIPSFVYTKIEIDSIDFVGRKIVLGSACRWMSPHNIQCPNYGQMNWAIFDNLQQAIDYRDTHFKMTKNRNMIDVKEEKWITLKFEGQETQALRTKVKIQLPKLVMGGSNLLVVYYVTAQIRGKYVTSVLSQYTDDVGADKLAPLLGEVLELIAEEPK